MGRFCSKPNQDREGKIPCLVITDGEDDFQPGYRNYKATTAYLSRDTCPFAAINNDRLCTLPTICHRDTAYHVFTGGRNAPRYVTENIVMLRARAVNALQKRLSALYYYYCRWLAKTPQRRLHPSQVLYRPNGVLWRLSTHTGGVVCFICNNYSWGSRGRARWNTLMLQIIHVGTGSQRTGGRLPTLDECKGNACTSVCM